MPGALLAWLPHAARYVSAFKAGFDGGLGAVQLLFMQSDGGLAPADDFSGHKAILSGPAGAQGAVCMLGLRCREMGRQAGTAGCSFLC